MDKARGNNRHMEVLLVGRTEINLLRTPTHMEAHQRVDMAPAQILMEAVPKAPTASNPPRISHPIQRPKHQGMVSHRAMVNHLDMVSRQGMANMEVTRLQVI